MFGMSRACPDNASSEKSYAAVRRSASADGPSFPCGRCRDAVEQKGSLAAIARFVRAFLLLAIQPNRPRAEAKSHATAGIGTAGIGESLLRGDLF